MKKFFKKIFLLLMPIAIFCVGCGETPPPSIQKEITFEWENNKDTLSGIDKHVKLFANIKYGNETSPIATWTIGTLPQGVSKNINNNYVTFILDETDTVSVQTINIKAKYKDIEKNTILNISQWNKPIYDYNITLNMSSANITQANLVSLNNPIVLNASITDLSGGPISDNVTWSGDDTLPSYITVTKNNNEIKFSLVDNEETSANTYTIDASYSVGAGAATKTFVLSTENYEYWNPVWIPKEMLNIQGTTLNGFKTGVNLSSYTTMHIPKEITTIANNSFFDQSATSSKIPSNINVLDMSSASVLTNIGQRAFYEAPFSNTLIFPSSLTTLGGEAFCSSSIAGVNLSHCNLLLTVPGGCFGDCNSISTIDFNNNLQYIQNPIGAAGFGAFEVNGLSYSGSSFTGTLKLPSGIRELGNAAFANLGAQPGTTTNVVAINWNSCTQLTRIGRGCFAYVPMAPNTKIIFPDGITYLDSFCIQTNNITEVEIPASVSTINADGLADMSNLKIVKIHRTSSVYPYADADKTGYLSTLPFGLWVRKTKIEPGKNITSESGAYMEVPSSLLSTYQSTWPNWIAFQSY